MESTGKEHFDLDSGSCLFFIIYFIVVHNFFVSVFLLKLCHFILSHRSQGSHGICSGYTRYCYLLASNDVLNNSSHSVFHCVDCWWRHNSHAVMAEHQVSKQLYAGEMSLFK